MKSVNLQIWVWRVLNQSKLKADKAHITHTQWYTMVQHKMRCQRTATKALKGGTCGDEWAKQVRCSQQSTRAQLQEEKKLFDHKFSTRVGRIFLFWKSRDLRWTMLHLTTSNAQQATITLFEWCITGFWMATQIMSCIHTNHKIKT